MITVVVEFSLPVTLTRDEAREIFRNSAPIYLGEPGLLLKTYIFDEAAGTAGGIYVWENRSVAERAFDEAWRERVRRRWGTEPTLRFLESPVVVDNRSARIVVD
jgi:hypothetical protein